MSNDPTRLSDDAAFIAESGCHLRDERALLASPNLPNLRARIVRRSHPLAALTRWGWLVGGVLLLLGVGFGARSVSDGRDTAETPSLATTRKTELSPASTSSPSAVTTTSPPASTQPQSGSQARGAGFAPASHPAPPNDLVSTSTTRNPSRAVLTDPSPDPTATAAPVAGVLQADSGKTDALPGDLAPQLAAFNEAEGLFSEGNAARALIAYGDYLTRWPDGHFRAEAELGRLRATAASGNFAATVELATRLSNDPALAPRHDEILLLQAQALAKLGRCAEARVLAKTMAPPARANAIAACR